MVSPKPKRMNAPGISEYFSPYPKMYPAALKPQLYRILGTGLSATHLSGAFCLIMAAKHYIDKGYVKLCVTVLLTNARRQRLAVMNAYIFSRGVLKHEEINNTNVSSFWKIFIDVYLH